MSDAVVEPATRNDLEALLACWESLVGSQRAHGTHLLAAENRETARGILRQQIAAGTVLVARLDGAVVGFASLTIERGAFEQDAVRGLVENLYVVPAHRDAGVGTELLEAAADRLRDAGAEVVAVEAMADNAAARALYERRGFEPHRVTYERPASDTHSREGDG